MNIDSTNFETEISMLKMKLIVLSALFAVSGYADRAEAAIGVTVQCLECTPQQMAAKADAELGSRGLHAPPIYVVDWSVGVVRKYAKFNNMTPEWNPEFDPLITWNEEVPVESVVASNIAAIRQLQPAVKAIIREVVNADNTNTTAYHVIDNQHMESAVGTYLDTQTTAGTRAAYHQLAASVLAFMDPSYLVKVVFSDGSWVVYQFVDGNFERVEGMAKDRNGNSIPEKREDFADGGVETYLFNGAGDPAGQMFYERASLMNIIISPPDINQVFTYVCVSGPENIVCYIQVF